MIDLNVYCKPKMSEQFLFEWKTNGKTNGKAVVEGVYSDLYILDSKEIAFDLNEL